jgi:hypothetical protein
MIPSLWRDSDRGRWGGVACGASSGEAAAAPGFRQRATRAGWAALVARVD